jgi:hypothetical protein
MAYVPSSFCLALGHSLDVGGFHVCDENGTLTVEFALTRGSPFNTPQGPEDLDTMRANASKGWGQGMLLAPLTLDWGDTIPKPRRRHFLTTALKSYPRREDRLWAWTTIADFVSPLDSCDPPMTFHLLKAAPFVGYGWDAHALEKWLNQIQVDPCGAPPRQPLPEPEAFPLAVAWLELAAKAWRLLTAEPFPYDVLDLIEYWTVTPLDADLSDTLPTEPDL